MSRRRSPRQIIWTSTLALVLLVASTGCERCNRSAAPPPIAKLVELRGHDVQRDYAPRPEQWEPATLGAEFRLGDGLRTAAPAQAVLALADGSSLLVRPGTTLRFLAGGANAPEQGVDVTTGEALLRAGRRDVSLRTHVGVAILEAGTQVRLSREGHALDLRVEVGEARFRSAQGEDVTLSAGQQVQLMIGMAMLRDTKVAARESAPQDAGTPGAVTSDSESEDAERGADDAAEAGPDYANFTVRAGESFTVHAPEVPVAIAFDFRHACKDGAVELTRGKQRGRGAGRGNLLFPAGVRGYAVRCAGAGGKLGSVVARGTVRVLKDAGTRKLPPKPPTSIVDADGRKYTVYYQNQLPDISVRWPNAPRATRYALDVDGRTMWVQVPEHLFRSGTLRDGVHRLTFEAAGRKSRTAEIQIRFDNAAPTASLIAPEDRSFAPGDTVRIEGVALPSWKVSVHGGTIELDEGDRFEGQVVTSAAQPDIAVRLSHRRLGTHYYLRRAASSR